MNRQDSLKTLAAECEQELRDHILPFWMNLRDPRGGFFGQVTHALTLHRDAPKGIILHARILWTFSAAYLRFREPQYLEAARHACDFLQQAWDMEHGGFYWSMTADGKPFETNKYAYCSAFCIYGLTLYSEAAGDRDALALALKAFDCIEERFAQRCGYIEAFTENWLPLENDHLSEHDLHAAKTMNTTLHLIEAYAELYRVTKYAYIGEALHKLLRLIADEIYQPDERMLGVFFDGNLSLLGDLHSYGHDIEASWLLDHACDCLGKKRVTAEFRTLDYTLANHVYEAAFRDGALYNERFMQDIDKTRVWWVQAEGVLGFLNAAKTAELLKKDSAAADRFISGTLTLWDSIKAYQIDRRPGGEWFSEINTDGTPRPECDMAGLWKCPYHNSRMCLEVIRRVSDDFI
ncbi:MAG: AGE family epimerase/isomerase [Oscillospiraceae bacterium]|nr:AGE family epimerase/isomerase [Oscillospiraceae bacterium]